MPPPKDPEKLKEYREKMRRIALERGYGKWMKGKTRTPESIEKTRQANVGKTISEEHRAALRTARQKEVGEGKELFGGEAGKEKRVATVREQRQGKTYEEIYGDRAEEEARKRRDGNVGAHANRSPHPNRGGSEPGAGREKLRGNLWTGAGRRGISQTQRGSQSPASSQRSRPIAPDQTQHRLALYRVAQGGFLSRRLYLSKLW